MKVLVPVKMDLDKSWVQEKSVGCNDVFQGVRTRSKGYIKDPLIPLTVSPGTTHGRFL